MQELEFVVIFKDGRIFFEMWLWWRDTKKAVFPMEKNRFACSLKTNGGPQAMPLWRQSGGF
jgi:hypothetical protein